MLLQIIFSDIFEMIGKIPMMCCRRSSIMKSKGIETTNLLSKNSYESQILASLSDWTGDRIHSYSLTGVAESKINEFNLFKYSFQKEPVNKFFVKKESGPHKNTDTFECDFYFRESKEQIVSAQQLFGGSTETLHQKAGDDGMNIVGKWILTEISLNAQHARQKLYQLERASYFLSLLDPTIQIGAAVILLNGPEVDAERANELFSMPTNSYLTKFNIPVFIGWVPTMNIYKVLNRVETDVAGLKTDVAGLKTDVAGLKTDMFEVKTLLRQLVNQIPNKL
jgi:hypothetical protein